MNTLVSCRGITKAYPGVRALNHVDFDLRAGEVHALCGENGAGKSTLMHILAGVEQPDVGSIEIDGSGFVRITDERHAQGLGISIVYQERSLFHLLSLAENLFVNRQPASFAGIIDFAALRSKARELLAQVELHHHPDLPAGKLSPAEQQMLEIAKALALDSRIFILDEPTAALTVAETQTLFALIRKLTARGVGVIYISHRLEEIFEIADRVTVLKDGTVQGTWECGEVTLDQLVSKMVGRERLFESLSAGLRERGRPLLEVRNASDRKLKRIGFQAYAGEILGFAGLAGAGRTELALSIFGARELAEKQVLVDGNVVEIRSPLDAMEAGIGYLPEDRKEEGLFLEMNVAENIAAAKLDAFGNWRLRDDELTAVAQKFMQRLSIAAPGYRVPAVQLSGGNQQKILLSRWLLREPKILIVDEPTRGIDVGAKAEIYKLLRQLAGQGKAVIVISSDLPEVLAICDRILVMRQGQITCELSRQIATEEMIMRYAATELAAVQAP